MALEIKQASSGIEKTAIKIAAVGLIGGIGLYALFKNAGGISNFIGSLGSKLGSFVTNGFGNLLNANGFNGSLSNGGQGDFSNPTFSSNTGISNQNVQAAISQAGLPGAVPGTEQYLAAASQLPSGELDKALQSLLGNTSVNSSGDTAFKTAENALISQLSQQGANQLIGGGQTAVGLYKVSSGVIEPLTQAALDYYHSIGVNPQEVVKY